MEFSRQEYWSGLPLPSPQYTLQEMKAGLSLFIHSSNKYLLHDFCMLSPAIAVYSGNKTAMVPAPWSVSSWDAKKYHFSLLSSSS